MYQRLILSPSRIVSPPHHGVLRAVATEVHDRRGPPQDLLDRAGQVAVGVAHQQLVLVGVLEERVHPVRDGVARRLVAGDRQQQEEEVEVHVRQRLAVDLAAEQRGDDVVARVAPSLLGQLLGVHEHLDLGLEHLLVGHRVLRVLGADHAVAPLEDLVAVVAGHADELGDHLERELGGDLDDEVHLVALRHRRVEHLIGELADVRLELPDHPRGEAAVHQLAVPGVVRRVHQQHEVAAARASASLGRRRPAPRGRRRRPAPPAEENEAASRLHVMTSACLLITQKPGPSGSGCL